MSDPAEPRTPHADRGPARPLCRCVWAYRQNPRDPDGPALETRVATIPSCPLHGDRAEPAPF